MKFLVSIATLSALVFGLAACGETRLDRSVSGAGIGAAGGAVLGAVVGGPILGAAAIGTVAGAAVGAVTDKDQVNLGKAWWNH